MAYQFVSSAISDCVNRRFDVRPSKIFFDSIEEGVNHARSTAVEPDTINKGRRALTPSRINTFIHRSGRESETVKMIPAAEILKYRRFLFRGVVLLRHFLSALLDGVLSQGSAIH